MRHAGTHGCTFLQGAFWDTAYGGFFAEVDREGRPNWEGLKHPHAVTYAARAFLLAEPYLPRNEGRLWACRAMDWLDDVAWDTTHGGYWGSFRRNNERYPDRARLPTPNGRDWLGLTPGFKEVNTLSDALETLTDFVAHGVTGRCADRLTWLIDLIVRRLTDPNGILPYLYWPDWRPVPDLVRIGQQFQMIHRLVAAAGVNHAVGLVTRSRELSDFCLASARHPSGGFCFAVSGDGRTWPSTNPTTDLRQWWVQLEAARALHVLATHESIDSAARALYERARDEQWGFVRDHYFDTRYGGIWEYPRKSSLPWHALLPYRLSPNQPNPRPARPTVGKTRCTRLKHFLLWLAENRSESNRQQL